jgi:predicted nucleotide-binding protein
MAQKRQERTMLLVPLDKTRAQISEQIEEGQRLLESQIGNMAELKQARFKEREWVDFNVKLLESIVNTDELVNDYLPRVNVGFSPLDQVPLPKGVKEFHSDLEYLINRLKSILNYLPLIPEAPALAQPVEPQPVDSRPEVGRRVFIVHGHDEEAKQSVARCLEKLELEPIILHEQPSQGRTIIEKFEGYAGVGFAVVLLTPDDVGAAKDDVDNFKPRARQNVVFELGFFVGKLGRDRVCALHKGDVEIPSDFAGVVYVPMGPGDAWRFDLVREMNAAGLDVDSNKLL